MGCFENVVFVSLDIIQSKSIRDKEIKGLLEGIDDLRLGKLFLTAIWGYDFMWFRSIIKQITITNIFIIFEFHIVITYEIKLTSFK